MKAKPYQIEALKAQIQKQYKGALIYGPDFSVTEDCAEQIIPFIVPKKDDFSFIKITKSQLKETPTLLLDEGNTVSLLGGRKLIWLKDADNTLVQAVEDYITYIKSDTFLLITADNLLKSSALRVFCENNEQVLTIACYADEEKDVRFLIQNYLKTKGYTVSETALSLLQSRLNENRQATKNELEKLITYLGERTHVEEKDVIEVISDTSSATADMLVFAVANGQHKEADNALRILFLNGENPVSITRILSLHFNKLLIGADLVSKRVSGEEICKKLLRANQFRLKEQLLQQVYKWKKEYLCKTLQLLLETEQQTKTTGMPAELIVERAVTMITGLGKRLNH